MNRFAQNKTSTHTLRRAITSIAGMCLAIALLLWGVSAIRRSSDNSQIDSLRQAILRSAVHCYAMKGRYPESLDYIKEHYGIDWDSDRYVIDYEIMGSNLMPDVTVFPIGGKEAPHAD